MSMVKAGDKAPEGSLSRMGSKGPEKTLTKEYFAGRKVVVFGVPGAFTPTCSNAHLPGFVERASEVMAKGVDAIGCVSVNDAFVMNAWGKDQGVGGKVDMLADGNGEWTRALGLEMDGSGFGMGLRSQRYAMVVSDGVVEWVGVESGPGTDVSGVESVLSRL